MLANVRDQFPIFSSELGYNLAYLDNAASTQKPEMVLQKINECYRQYFANVHRGVYQLAEKVTAEFEGSRAKVAEFLHARSADEIIFTRNATDGLNLLAQSYCETLQQGDEILLTEMEHHACLVPWQQNALKRGLVIKYLPIDQNGRLKLDDIEQYFTKRTKVLAVTAMSNVLGTINDLPKLAQLAKAVGTATIVDAAQAAPHFPINVQELDIAALVFTGHKIYGPTGVGAVWGKAEFLNILPPYQYGGHMINNVSYVDTTWALPPTKFEAGTPPIAEVIGLGTALDFVSKIGWPAILQHEADLTNYSLERLRAVNGLRMIGPITPENRGPVFAFTVSGIHPHDLASVLDSVGVAVRAGHHCAQPLHNKFGLTATTRASLAIYNTRQEIDRLAEGIEKAKRMLA